MCFERKSNFGARGSKDPTARKRAHGRWVDARHIRRPAPPPRAEKRRGALPALETDALPTKRIWALSRRLLVEGDAYRPMGTESLRPFGDELADIPSLCSPQMKRWRWRLLVASMPARIATALIEPSQPTLALPTWRESLANSPEHRASRCF